MRLAYNRHYLSVFFEPDSVAVIGATEKPGKPGEVVFANLLRSNYRGALFAVNSKYDRVQETQCYRSLDRLPQRADLAVIATAANSVPRAVEQCGRAGIRAVLIVTPPSARDSAKLAQESMASARRYGMRLLGPGCLGLWRPHIGLNAAFARAVPATGSLGLVSQSGSVCAAMLDWAQSYGAGFSSIVSLGGSADVDLGEVLDYLASDTRTEHILVYLEHVHDARRFLSSLRGAARTKPVLLMKAGRHPASSGAPARIVGSDDVFEAAMRRVGVVRVRSVGQLVAAADALAARVRPHGNRLAVISNGGGPGRIAADRALDLGLGLASLSEATLAVLRDVSQSGAPGNPLDIGADADAARYRAAVCGCLADPGVDGILVMLSPQVATDAVETAQALIGSSHGAGKPVIACWMGESSVAPARALLKAADIPTFRTPDPAVEVFAHMAAFFRNQQALLQVPPPLLHRVPPDLGRARSVVEQALKAGVRSLGQAQSKALLAAFSVAVTRTAGASSAEEAVAAARDIGFPVAMKIDSPDITHKNDASGVHLNLGSAEEVRVAYDAMLRELARRQPRARLVGVSIESMLVRPYGRKLMVGVVRDEVFGPAIVFGAGGAVDVHRDRSVALPPLNAFLAARLITATRVAGALGTFRGMPPVDRQAIEEVLLRISEMVCELPQIVALEINPLLADESGATVLDARVTLRQPSPSRGRYGHMAVHPYPSALVRDLALSGGVVLKLRPVRPEDAEMEAQFVRGLSDASRYARFMGAMKELSPAMLARFTQIDYDREMALVALLEQDGREVQVGAARYVTNPDGESCEFAIAVADEWQRHGLGRRLLDVLSEVARARGISAMVGYVLASNTSMLSLCERLGFEASEVDGERNIRREVLRLGPGLKKMRVPTAAGAAHGPDGSGELSR